MVVNLIGITWGLPGQGQDLPPALVQGAVAEEADQAWATAQDPERNLNLGPPAADRPETAAKVLRRFALYTADPDEVVALMAVARLNPLAGRWDPGFGQYGGFFLYALGGSFKVASSLGFVTLRGDPSFYIINPARIARIYTVGRLLVVLVGALGIPIVWLLARPIYGAQVALVAAGLAAVSPAWIAWNHVMKPHGFGSSFALGALAVSQRLPTSARPLRTTIGAGVLAGLAAGTALHYIVILLGPGVGAALRGEERTARRLMLVSLASGAALLVLLAVHPYWLLNPRETMAAWRAGFGWFASDYHPQVLLAFAWGTLGSALGLPLVAAAGIEGIRQGWRRRGTLPILVPAAVMLCAMAIRTGGTPGDATHARLVLPAALLLAMLAAGGICRAAKALPRQARAIPFLLLLPTLMISAALLRNFVAASGPEGTRHRAGARINALPAGASIGVLSALAPFRSPYFRIDRYRVVIEPNPERVELSTIPDYFLLAERSHLSTSSAFLARYQEVQRFVPASFPLEKLALAVYPFADPPIQVFARRALPGEPSSEGGKVLLKWLPGCYFSARDPGVAG